MYYRPRRRKNPTTVRSSQFKQAAEQGIATGLGLVVSRTLSNMLLPGKTGYVKAGADAGIAAAAAMLLNAAKVQPKLVAAILTGGIASATIRIIDQVSQGRFGISVSGNYYEIPANQVSQARALLGAYQYQGQSALMGGVEDNVAINGPYSSPYPAPY